MTPKIPHDQQLNNYRARFSGYELYLDPHPLQLRDPTSEVLSVVVKDAYGETYRANFVTLDFLVKMFRKNRETGECASGVYFVMPHMVTVRALDATSVRRTIDDMVAHAEVELHFERVSGQQ